MEPESGPRRLRRNESAWLQAAAQIADLRIVGLADLDVERAKGRAAEFSLQDAVVGQRRSRASVAQPSGSSV